MGGKAPAMPTAPAPVWYDTEIWEGNTLKATQKKEGNTIKQQNIVSPEEQALKDRQAAGVEYYQKQIPQFEKKINTFDPAWTKEVENYGKQFTTEQLKKFDEQYTPAYNQLLEEAAQKFGTTNNSWYADELGKLQKVKADTIASVNAESSKQAQAFKQQELGNRQEYLKEMRTSLGQLQQGQGEFDQQQALKRQQNVDLGTKASEVTNNYNANTYSSRIEAYKSQMAARQALMSSMMGGMFNLLGRMG